MAEEKKNGMMRPLIFASVAVPIICCLFYYADYKNKESVIKSAACEKKCTTDGFNGYDFKWNMLDGPKCKCFDTESKN